MACRRHVVLAAHIAARLRACLRCVVTVHIAAHLTGSPIGSHDKLYYAILNDSISAIKFLRFLYLACVEQIIFVSNYAKKSAIN